MSFQRKQEKDFTPEVKESTPEVEKLASSGKSNEAIDKISALEKQTRNASDMPSTAASSQSLVRLCWEQGDLEALNTQSHIMSKKHGQSKEAVVRMVDEAIPYLAELKKKKEAGAYKGKPDEWSRLSTTIRDITEGKIYLESQRARLTVMLAEYHEASSHTAPKASSSIKTDQEEEKAAAGDDDKEKKKEPVTAEDHLNAAADSMSDIQIETYSSMDKREKTEFILEQMRLESSRGNWSKVRVGSRKINRVYSKEPESSDLKSRYYDSIVQLALQDDNYLEVCNAYQAVWDTAEVKADAERELNVIENIIMYVVLAAYSNEQNDMSHKSYAMPESEKAPLHYQSLKCFVTRELMRWPGIEQSYGPASRKTPVFAPDSELGKKTGQSSQLQKAGTDPSQSPGDARWKQSHSRVIEHNIRVIEQYYSRITMARSCQSLDLGEAQAEKTLCKLINDKTVYGKIDRPKGVICFKKPMKTNQTLNVWSNDISKMLELVEKTSHLVSKEYAMHEANQAQAGKRKAVKA